MLSNVVVKFFPPNCNSILQPMDQGIIKNFKCFYKTAFIERLLDSFESEEDNESAYRMANSVSILDSLYWVKSSWAQETEKTINSFKHAGFHQQFA